MFHILTTQINHEHLPPFSPEVDGGKMKKKY